MDQVKFVILAGPRTGSTYLVDYLNAIDNVRCLSEVFETTRIRLRNHQAIDSRLEDMSFRDAHPFEYLDLLEQEARDFKWFGFKMIGNQNGTVIRKLCEDPTWRKIYLWRDNLLQQAISIPLAADHFGKNEWERTPDTARLTILPRDLMSYLHIVQALYCVVEAALSAAASNDVFAMSYDDLGQPGVMGRLLDFLGLPQAAIEAAQARTIGMAEHQMLKYDRGPALDRRLGNYSEIQGYFRNSRYRQWI